MASSNPLLRTWRAVVALNSVRKVRKSGSASSTARERSRKHLATQLGQLKGLFQKLGQVAESASTDDAMCDVVNRGAAIPATRVLSILKLAWRREPERVLAEIDPQGLAASLGQVHRARLRNGADVAIKVQFPCIREALTQDLSLAHTSFQAAKMFGLKFDTAEYDSALSDSLLGELDYLAEAAAQNIYARDVRASSQPVVVPRVVAELSGPTVLVTQWQSGVTIGEAARIWSPEDRAEAGRVMLTHVLTQLLRFGTVHGDLHTGNFAFRRGPAGIELVLYDFGSVCRLEEQEQSALQDLLLNVSRHQSDPLDTFLNFGFRREFLLPIASRCNAFCDLLLEPFTKPGRFDVNAWNLSARVGAVLGDDRWNFRAAAPARFLLLMRVFHGVTHALRRLRAAVDWQACLAQASISAGVTPTVSLPLSICDPLVATALVIQVVQDGETRVKLTLEASMLAQTDAWLSEELEARLVHRGIDAREIASKAIRQGYRKGVLFSSSDAENTISVRLE